jgi:hypothetical protein
MHRVQRKQMPFGHVVVEVIFVAAMLLLAVLALGRPQVIQEWAVRSNEWNPRFVRHFVGEFVASPQYLFVVRFVGVIATLFVALGVWAVVVELSRR